MENLDREKVLHVASLAKLRIEEDEIEKYVKELKDLMAEVDRIQEAKIDDEEILISPSANRNVYNDDTTGTMLTREEILKNANKKYGSYIAVTRALND